MSGGRLNEQVYCCEFNAKAVRPREASRNRHEHALPKRTRPAQFTARRQPTETRQRPRVVRRAQRPAGENRDALLLILYVRFTCNFIAIFFHFSRISLISTLET